MVPIRKTCGWFELSGGNGGPLPLSEDNSIKEISLFPIATGMGSPCRHEKSNLQSMNLARKSKVGPPGFDFRLLAIIYQGFDRNLEECLKPLPNSILTYPEELGRKKEKNKSSGATLDGMGHLFAKTFVVRNNIETVFDATERFLLARGFSIMSGQKPHSIIAERGSTIGSWFSPHIEKIHSVLNVSIRPVNDGIQVSCNFDIHGHGIMTTGDKIYLESEMEMLRSSVESSREMQSAMQSAPSMQMGNQSYPGVNQPTANIAKYCPYCGKPIQSGWQNCTYCGNKLP